MAVNLSPYGGVGAQFFSNNGVPLAGGKIFTYSAGTTTPQATYTSANGVTAHANPIILDAAGRVPGGEIWLTDGLQYKFVLKDANDITLATYDNVVGINSNFINYTNEQEIQTATAGQTVFTLTTMQYQPGTGSLSVFVDGVNQYGPGAQYAYVETDSTTVTFVSGLHVGASVKFTTAQINAASYGDASQISYTAPFTAAVTTNVENKLSQTVSVLDFNADPTGVLDSASAFTAAGSIASTVEVNIPGGVYRLNSNPAPTGDVTWVVDKGASFVGTGRLSYLSAKIVSRGAYRSIESDPTFYNGIYGYLEQNAAETGYGVIGLHGSVQSAGGAGTTGEADIGVAAFGAHNLVGSTGGVWGLYSTVLRASGVNGATHGMELDVANFGTKVVLTPALPFVAGQTNGIWLCTGGETTEGGAGGSPGVASVGLAIIQNDSQAVKTAKFNKGILFHNTAIEGADGTGGSNLGIAIAFATGHTMQWYNNFDQVVGEITNSNATWTTTIMRMDFGPGVINFQDRATGVSRFKIGETGVIDFASAVVTGSAGAQFGFFTVAVNGTLLKIPVYNL